MTRLVLTLATLLSLAAAPAFAAPVTIGVKAPAGLTIKISAATLLTKDIKAMASTFSDGYYAATFSGGLPGKAALVCARVSERDWHIAFEDGATTDKLCFDIKRLSKATIGGKGALVFTAKFVKK
jgi:hypothetical protein